MCAPRDSSVHSCGPRRLRSRMSPSQTCPRPSGKGGSQRCRLRHPRRSARFPSRRPKRSCMRSTPHGRAVAARSSSSWAQMAASDARRPEYAGLSLGEAKGKAKRALICRGARAKQSLARAAAGERTIEIQGNGHFGAQNPIFFLASRRMSVTLLEASSVSGPRTLGAS